MPLHVQRIPRRRLIQNAFCAAAGLLAGCSNRGGVSRFLAGGLGDDSPQNQPETWALLSDAHVAADPRQTRRGVNMADGFREALDGVLSADARPAGLILSGDCAYLGGRSDDYATFSRLGVAPLAAAGVPMHLLLGNHDHRRRFRTALDAVAPPADALLSDRCVSVVEGRHARWFLLDSLDKTGNGGGRIGEAQLRWLSHALQTHDDRPALVMGHHPIAFGPSLLNLFNGDLRDGDRLWSVLRRHRHVKAYFYGHTHKWDVSVRHGIHLVNLPTTAYTFLPGQPRAWVDARIGPRGAELRPRGVGRTRRRATESVCLRWA